MRKHITNINPNKLHTELINNEIDPIEVVHDEIIYDKQKNRQIAKNTWIKFEEGADMRLAQEIMDKHDPTPLSKSLAETEMLMLAVAELDMQREQDKIETQLAIADLAETILGGVK